MGKVKPFTDQSKIKVNLLRINLAIVNSRIAT